MTTPASRDQPLEWLAGRLADLEDGVPMGVVLADGERVCVLRRGAQLWAVQDICPHRGFGLSGGECVEMADGTLAIECPWHGAQFSCASGAVLRGPATDAIATYTVHVRHGEVFIGERRDPE